MFTRQVAPSINLFCMDKGVERYVIVWNDTAEGKCEALRQLGRWASNPELSFSWYCAAVASNRIRQEASAK